MRPAIIVVAVMAVIAAGVFIDPLNLFHGENDPDAFTVQTIEGGGFGVKGETFTFTLESGEEPEYEVSKHAGEFTISFSKFIGDVEYTMKGDLNGSIKVDAGEHKFVLDLSSARIVSDKEAPITVSSGDSVSIKAVDGKNAVEDRRSEASKESDSAIYAACDLSFAGTAEINIVSDSNGAVHSKDDLKLKGANMVMESRDHCVKGNDSVTIDGGTYWIKSILGDGVKTKNTETKFDSNGVLKKQKGDILITSDVSSLDLTILSCYDGVDSAYGLKIVKGVFGLKMDVKTSGFADVKFNPTYDESTKGLKADDSIVIDGGNISIVAMDDAIHANNDVTLSGTYTSDGMVKHFGTGDVHIISGSFKIKTYGDAVDADGTIIVDGGDIEISLAFEGLHGAFVVINGGNINMSMVSDDGIHAKEHLDEGYAIEINGGNLTINALGDGLDTDDNMEVTDSEKSYRGVLLNGGKVVISCRDSCIDTDDGYSYFAGEIIGFTVAKELAIHEASLCNAGTPLSTTIVSNKVDGFNSIIYGAEMIQPFSSENEQIFIMHIGSMPYYSGEVIL